MWGHFLNVSLLAASLYIICLSTVVLLDSDIGFWIRYDNLSLTADAADRPGLYRLSFFISVTRSEQTSFNMPCWISIQTVAHWIKNNKLFGHTKYKLG